MKHSTATGMSPDRSTHGSVLTYTIGFVLSVVLTAVAYAGVVGKTFTANTAIAIIVGLAVAQLLVQLVFFLHLGRESRPRLNLLIFLFMLLVVGIVVAGSLWIMYNLDYNMTPQEMDRLLIEDEGVKL